MDLLPLDPDDASAMKVALDIVNATEAHDAPWRHPESLTTLDAQVRFGWDLEPGHHFLGVEAGEPVALAVLELTERDNLDLAWFEVAVAPEQRRRGHGSAALRLLEDAARDAGRTKAGAHCWETSPGEAFAAAHGYPRKFQSVQRRQVLAEVDWDRVVELRAHAEQASSAYELLRIEGATPADLLEQTVEMVAAINDAPLDELDIEDEVFTAERVAAYDTAQLRGGKRLRRVVARHRDTGAMAGHTVVAVQADRPWIGHQHDTAVVQSHRGHRLGLLLKTDMLLWLRETEPRLETVDTFNAESNDHMIAVNEQLGYRWMGRGLGFQRSLVDPVG